jgi:hypothetical protein
MNEQKCETLNTLARVLESVRQIAVDSCENSYLYDHSAVCDAKAIENEVLKLMRMELDC